VISEQFLNYIKNQRVAGIARDDIKRVLLLNGLSEQDIAEGFAVVEGVPTATLAVPAVPASVTPAAAAPISTSAVSEQMLRPQSVKYFEFLMYAGIAANIATTVYQYKSLWTQFNSTPLLLTLSTPVLILFIQFLLVWLASHQRKNWARIALLVPFLMNVLGVAGVIFLILRSPILGILSLLPLTFEIAGFSFAFSSSANKWFAPQEAQTGPTPGQATYNPIWAKGIPGTNMVFMIISLVLVFGLDLLILFGQWALLHFWIEMLIVQGIFVIFFYTENYSYSKRFASSRSALDSWIVALVVIRNIFFVLNAIPFIQIAGAAGLILGAIPFLILYWTLLAIRAKAV